MLILTLLSTAYQLKYGSWYSNVSCAPIAMCISSIRPTKIAVPLYVSCRASSMYADYGK